MRFSRRVIHFLLTLLFCGHLQAAQAILTAIGLMSGTSMDGVDVALIETDGQTLHRIGASETYPYPKDFQSKLRDLIMAGESSPHQLRKDIEIALTDFHIQAVLKFRETHQIQKVDVIGFHGHTFIHRPDRGYTIQLGDGQRLADRTGVPVVYNFRVDDVSQGGQGAPLAPIYHAALAAHVEKPCVIVNIGGVSNITYIADALMACDTGPGNALIDDWVYHHTGQLYDAGGQLAATGKVHEDILAGLLEDPFFEKKLPKSLDRNHFEGVMTQIKPLAVEDGAATLTAFTARSIAQIQRQLPKQVKNWYISGGGRHNKTLMKSLQESLTDARVVAVEALGEEYDGDGIEAQLMAYLAVRSLKKLPLSFPKTTGVKHPQRGGVLVIPNTLNN